MKRRDALTKLAKICQKLDSLNLDDKQEIDINSGIIVVPIRLYLFGSLLTNKPNPTDVDLILQYKDRYWSASKVIYFVEHGPLPIEKTISCLRMRMRMIHFESMTEDNNIENWMQEHLFEHNMQFVLIWECGFDWIGALEKIETLPIEWDTVSEHWNKHTQETAKMIMKEKGTDVAIDWMKTAIRKRSEELS